MKTTKNWTRKFIALALAIMSAITLVTPMVAQAAENTYYGGNAIAWKDFDVYSTSSCTTKIGEIYRFEGFTILLQNAPGGWLWVEYSTANGAKQGYISIPQDEWGGRIDGLAKLSVTSTVYYGRNDKTGYYGSYQTAGTVFAGEIVAVLAKNGNWAYIEYNTTAGRKRGYVSLSNLDFYNRPSVLPDFHNHNLTGEVHYVSGRKYVYSGPTSLYTQVGWVENENVVYYGEEWVMDEYNNSYRSQYIEYESGGQTKSGFLVFGP